MPRNSLPFDHAAALQGCARGERYALRALYDQEARWLFGVALRILRNRAAAEDVLQDAFLQIWKSASSYQPALGSARGWIFTVVRNRALNEVRRASHQVELEEGELAHLLDTAQVAEVHDDGHLRADAESLERCLQALEESKRQCIVFAFVDGFTHQQIADRLATPVGTVKSWIRRGLSALKGCLS